MIDGAAQILLLCAEKQLSLLSQMQDVGGIAEGCVDIVGDHDDCESGRLIDTGDLSVQASGRDRVQARYRLIQKNQLVGGAHSAGQEDPLLLTAGKVPVTLILQIQDLQSLHLFMSALFFHTGQPDRTTSLTLAGKSF